MDIDNQGQAPQQPVPVLVQNSPNYGDVLKNLKDQLTHVNATLASQGVRNVVQTYDGDPKLFREWVKSVEKYQRLTNSDVSICKMLAYQTSKGAVSGFVSRYLEQNPAGTWDELKLELEKRFSDVPDTSLALSMLRQIKQKSGENIQLYTERIRSLAEVAFRGQDGAVMQTQLVDIFVNGLCSEQFKLTILRKHPNTLEAALAIATDEQNLRQRVHNAKPFDTEQNHEPMDVSHMRRLRCFKCNRGGHKAQDCKNVRSVGRPTFVCWGCGQEGHLIRNCPGENNFRPPVGHGRSSRGQHNNARPSAGHGRPRQNQEN